MSKFEKFFEQDTKTIARALLGVELVYTTQYGTVAGYVVEDEAYFGMSDSASFAFNGVTNARNQPLYGPSGTIYIYKMYRSFILDVVVRPVGQPEGIMIRAVEPSRGQQYLDDRRPVRAPNQTNGPGKLTQAFGLTDVTLNGRSFSTGPLRLDFSQRQRPRNILTLTRRGDQTVPVHLLKSRFAVAGNPFIAPDIKTAKDPTEHGWQTKVC